MTRKEIFLLLLLAVVQFAHIVDFMVLMPLGPGLQKLFEITPQQFGLLVSSYSFSAGVVGFLGATYTDRFDRKHVLLASFTGFTIGTFACSQAESYEMLLLARILTGALGGLTSSTVLSIASDAIAPQRRAQAMGVVTSAFSVASAIGVPAALKLATLYHWNTPFLALAGISVLVIVMIIFLVPNVRFHLAQGRVRRSPLEMSIAVLSDGNQIRALLLMTFLMMAQFTLIPFIPTYLVRNVGFNENQLFNVYLVGGIFSFMAGPLVGKLADRIGRLRVFVIAALVSFIPVLLLTNLGQVGVPAAVAVTTLFFIVSTGRSVPAFAMITSVVTARQRGSFMSINTATQHVSLAFAAMLGGLIVKEGAGGKIEHYPIAGIICVGFVLITIFIASTLKPVKEELPQAGTAEPDKK